MPCCALAAVLVGQMLLALGAIRATLFGRPRERSAGNPSVEWRLDAPATAAVGTPPRPIGGFLPGGRVLAVAVAVEIVLVAGAIVGLAAHLGHDGGHDHALHTHEVSP